MREFYEGFEAVHSVPGYGYEAPVGLGRVVAVPNCSSTLYQVHSDNRSLFF
jgi:hypothetical protein